MRRKELMARALAAGLAAVQVGSSVAQVTYAAESVVEEGSTEEEESSEESGGTESSEAGETNKVEGASEESEAEESSETKKPIEAEETSEVEESTEAEEPTEESGGTESSEAEETSEAEEPTEVEDSTKESGGTESSEAEETSEAEEPTSPAQNESPSKTPQKAPQKAPAAVADTVVITVVDIFVDDDDNELFWETRTEDEVDEGTEYSYSALEDESLTVIGKTEYSGTATEDITISFRYRQEEQIMLATDYTVSFDTDGGNSLDSQVVAGNGYAADPGTPVKDGYKFLYWSRYKTGGSAVDISSYKITEDTVFYAYWREAEHTVTFNYNGSGTADMTIQVEDDTIPEEPERPTRDGYIFTGWTKDKSFADTEDYEHFDWETVGGITEDTTFYAKWVPAVTVTITDHFYDLEGNEVAVIPRDTVTMCKGAYFSNHMGDDWWHEGLNPYHDTASLTGYLSTNTGEWVHQYAASKYLPSDYDVSNLVVDDPTEIENAYEHFKRETVYVDASGKQSTGIETSQQAITNGQHDTSSHDTDHHVYGNETIDYYYREVPVYTYEVVDHYGEMVDGNFVEDHKQSRGTESFRDFYLQHLNKKKVPVNPDGAYKSLAQIKYHGYKVDSPGIKNTTWGAIVIDEDALVAVDETLTDYDVIVKEGFLGDDSNYYDYCVGGSTIDLYYVSNEWSVAVTDEVYDLDGNLISSTPRETEYFAKDDKVSLYSLKEPGYVVTSIESTSGDALDSVNLDTGKAVIDSLSQNTGVTFKYTAYPADNTLQIVEVIKNTSGKELSRTEKPMVSYDRPTSYMYTPPTGCTFSRLVKGVYKYPSGEQDAGLTYENMTSVGVYVSGHMYVELEFVKEIKLTVNKHVLDSSGKEVGVQTETIDYTGTILPDKTHENLPLVKYSYTYTPSGGTETTVDVTDVSNLTGIPVNSNGNVTLDAYYQEVPTKKYKIKVIDETYDKDQKTLIDRTEREIKEVPENTSYTVSAQTPNNYYNLGEDTVMGTANEDGEVVFKYAKYIMLNVEDVYNESDGTLIEKVSRNPLQYKLNESYSVAAQPEHGGYSYNIIGSDKYEGTATADANLTFTYRKKAHHKVTIIDKYYEPDGVTPIEEVERPVEEYPEGSTPVIKPDPKPGFDPKEDGDKTIPDISEDTVIIFEYVRRAKLTVVDEYYGTDGSTLIDSLTRPSETYKPGSGYSITPQAVHGGKTYTIMNPEVLKGTIANDLEVHIKYRQDEAQKKLFKIAVYDEFYEADGTTLKERVLRSNEDYVEGSSQTFSAISKDGYSVFSPASGTVQVDNLGADTEVVFKYKADKKPTYKVTIIDKYYEPDGVTPIEEVKRPVEEHPEGSSPVIKPNPKPGFDPKDEDGETIPNIDKDTEIVIEYVKRVTVTVVDEYYGTDGTTPVGISTRTAETYKPGDGYSIAPQEAYNGKSYTVMNPEVLKGTTGTADITIVIKYRQDEAQKKLFKITVYDEYYNTSGTVLRERVLRSNNQYTEGSKQTFSASGKSGYTVFSPSSGTVTIDSLEADTEVVFKYKANKKSGGGGGGGSKPVDPVTPPVEPVTPPAEPGQPPIEPVTPPTEPEQPPVEPQTPQPTEPEQVPVKKEFTITVIDKCFDRNGTALISYDRRLVETVEEGSEYSYSALDLDGFKVKGVSTYEGTVHGNLVLEFTYVREAQYTITVVDKYVSTDKIPYTPEHPEDIITSSTYTDTEGGTTYTVLVTVRQVDTLPEGSPYEYYAKGPKGFVTSGQKVLKGTVGDDLVLEFTYVIDGVGDLPKDIDKPIDKELVKPQKVLITIVDKYISEEPITGEEDTVVVETIKGEDGKTYVVTGSVRLVEAFIDGDGYEYKALDLDGFQVKGSRVARGKATEDKTVEFVYTTIDDGEVPTGVFQHKVNYTKKTADDDIKTFIPHAEEPKTGESIPLASTGFMMLALAFIEYLKKKFRR